MTERDEKRKYGWLMLVPYLLASLLMVIAGIIVGQIETMKLLLFEEYHSMQELTDKLYEAVNSVEVAQLTCLIYSVAGIILFSIMYVKFRKKEALKKTDDSKLPINIPLTLAGVVITVMALKLVTNIVACAVMNIFPEWYVEYSKIANSNGFDGTFSVLLILYSCVLGPIIEELIFRGLTFSYAKKVFSPIGAIIYQTVLFMLFHANKFQASYVLVVGAILGYVMYKYDNIVIVIGMHILYNVLSMVDIPFFTELSIEASPIIFFIKTLLVFVALWGGIRLLKIASNNSKVLEQKSDK